MDLKIEADLQKQKALDGIRKTSVHNRDDLVLIVKTLKSQDSFKVLCGCVALEKFLEEEYRLEKLNYHLD